MRNVRAILGGLALIGLLYVADSIGAAVLEAGEQNIALRYQLVAACAVTLAASYGACAFERRRRGRGLPASDWYIFVLGGIALGTFGAALHASVMRGLAHYVFNGVFFHIAAPTLRRWRQDAWNGFWRLADRRPTL
ncbi:MAG: hypothetical protein NVSMB64_23780 [Candidatus Velthaea sp.]